MLKAFLAAALTFVLCVVPAAAQNMNCPARPATQFPPGDMTFRVEYYSGVKVLIGSGGVAGDTHLLLDNAIRASLPIDEIWFNSPGGNASVGPRMGEVIRRHGIATRIPNGYWCVSACNFAFLGGPIRMIDPGGQYAIHMFTHLNSFSDDTRFSRRDGTTLEEYSARAATEQNDYLIRMGVSRDLIRMMYNQPARGVRCLTPDEMRRLNVINF